MAQNFFTKEFIASRGFREFMACSLACLGIPLLLGHLQGLPNQLIVGTSVNFILAFAAVRLSGWKSFATAIPPSIGAYLTGIVFGASTQSLLYFIPFIWAGNLTFILLLKKAASAQALTVKGVAMASFAKAGLLFAAALCLVFLGVVPPLFLTAMGPVQLATALSGGFLAKIVFGSLPPTRFD